MESRVVAVWLPVALALLLLGSSNLRAEEWPKTTSANWLQELLEGEPRGGFKVSEVFARQVTNRGGVPLGFVEDVLLDEQGRISYLVLSRGSAFGDIGPLLPLPWDTVHGRVIQDRVVVDVDPERLKDAPGLGKDAWAQFLDPQYRQYVNGYYETGPQK